jgi:nucleoside-triphosphatase
MSNRQSNILVTGDPGVGKTTLIVKLAGQLKDLNPVGFYTHEIRRDGRRTGFELVALNGARQVLSHVDIESRSRVGKYGVDVAGFERFLDDLDWSGSLFIVDEIGKMECLSSQFQELITEVLDSDSIVVATIARKGPRFISDIGHRDDCVLVEVTRTNRDTLLSQILKRVEGLFE